MDLHPVIKKFLRETGGADVYDGLRIRYVLEKPIDLIIEEGAHGPQKIDLRKHGQSQESLHALMKEHGFEEQSLRNLHPQCARWARSGECDSNAQYMQETCPKACVDLSDEHEECANWAARGECVHGAKFMLDTCALSCKGGGPKTEL